MNETAVKKIKICGICSEETAEVLNECLPDYVGFVFAPSRRRIDEKTANRLNQALSRRIRRVGVFTDNQPDTVKRLCGEGVLDAVQLHYECGAAYAERIKRETGAMLIKAVRVDATGKIRGEILDCADIILVDAFCPAEAGGTGIPFDWRHFPTLKKPVFLAGGIRSANIAAAAVTSAWGLDVSSGVETDGQKDPRKIRELIDLVRAKRSP